MIIRRRADSSHRPGRYCCGSEDLPVRPQFLSLDRARAEAALEWGKDRLGSISKQSDRYLRGLFVVGALAVIRYAKIQGAKHRPCFN
jgi:hypothetical protein